MCKADDDRRGRGHDEVPQIMATALREAGIAEVAISIIADEQEAVEHALQLAEPDDLVMVFGDAITRCWKQITQFNREPGVEGKAEPSAASTTYVAKAPKVVPMLDSGEPDPFVLDAGMTLVSDERGVRIEEVVSEDSD